MGILVAIMGMLMLVAGSVMVMEVMVVMGVTFWCWWGPW